MAKSAIRWVTTDNAEPVDLIPETGVVVSNGRSTPSGFWVERWRIPPFDHPETVLAGYSVGVLISTSGVVETYERGRWQRYQLYAGNVALFSAGHPRRNRAFTSSDTAFIELSPAFVQQAVNPEMDWSQPELITACNLRDAQIGRLVLTLNQEIESGNPSGRLFAETVATALALYLVRNYAAHGQPSPLTHAALSQQQLQCAIDYLQAHLHHDISLATLAQEVSFSPYHFARLFKQATGLAPHQYVIQQRIERAKLLLRTTNVPIWQIAQTVGYNDQGYFATLFKKATGATPKAYRDSTR